MDDDALDEAKASITDLCHIVHEANKRWWFEPQAPGHTGAENPRKPRDRNVGELLMLTVSELAEAMEGHRKDLMDDKLPHRKMFEVEIADALIRIFDIAGGMNLDLGGAFAEKMAYNAKREDHTDTARLAPGGKKY